MFKLFHFHLLLCWIRREAKQYHVMTDDLPSRGTWNTPSFPTISDYDGLGQSTLVTNFIVSALLLPYAYRSSHRKCFVTKVVPRNLAKFTWDHLWQSLFFDKVARPATLLKKDSEEDVFLWILRNFLEHLLLQNTSGRLLLSLTRWNYICESQRSIYLFYFMRHHS